jgi:Na+/melibiose symporter-like transporter
MQDAQIINAEHRLPDDTSGVSDEEGDTVTSLVSLVSGKSAKGRLTLSERLSYGVGHVLNDLTAACWFTYLLPFLTETLTYPEAGTVFLSGQIADAIATPLVGFTHFVPADQAAGIYSDRTVSRFGKRKIWAAGGALLVLFSFGLVFPVFNECVPCILFKTSSSIVKV